MILNIVAALFIGLTLGLLGSGGSILTVPMLTYLAGQETKLAIASSLIIVGTISLFSAIPYATQKLIHFPTVFLFGIAGIICASLGAWIAQYLLDGVQMIMFASLMLISAFLMFRPMNAVDSRPKFIERPAYKVIMDGSIIGLITGMIGIGGGFLIIPALVILGQLSMRIAVGTSLIIISINSFTGFIGYLPLLDKLNLSLDWNIIYLFSGIGVIGGFAGQRLSKVIDQESLKKFFAILLFTMGAFILWKILELYSLVVLAVILTVALIYFIKKPINSKFNYRLFLKKALSIMFIIIASYMIVTSIYSLT